MKSIPKLSAEQEAMRGFLQAQHDGAELTWLYLEAESGVKMDRAGRDMVRLALASLKRPYESLRGEGVRLSSPGTALDIVRGRFVKIDRTVTLAERTQRQLTERHFEAMDQRDRNKMLSVAAFFGAVRAIAQTSAPEVLRLKKTNSQ